MFSLFGSNDDNALELLRTDHDEVRKLFEEFEDRKEDADATTKLEIVETICLALVLHASVEEELFYPAVGSAEDAGDLIDEAAVEHQTLKDLIAQLQDSTPGDALYDAKVKVLGEYVQHHVREEEGEIFPKARSADIDLDALGRRMKARKEELMQMPTLPEHTITQARVASRTAARKQAKRAPARKGAASQTARGSTAKTTRGAARSR